MDTQADSSEGDAGEDVGVVTLTGLEPLAVVLNLKKKVIISI